MSAGTINGKFIDVAGLSINGVPVTAGGGGGGVSSVSGTAGNITSSGGANPIINLATAGTAGTTAYPASITTDAYGRITSKTAGSAPPTIYVSPPSSSFIPIVITGGIGNVSAYISVTSDLVNKNLINSITTFRLSGTLPDTAILFVTLFKNELQLSSAFYYIRAATPFSVSQFSVPLSWVDDSAGGTSIVYSLSVDVIGFDTLPPNPPPTIEIYSQYSQMSVLKLQ